MEGGPVDELLGATVERPMLDQLQVAVGRTLEDRLHAGLTGDDREERHLHAVDFDLELVENRTLDGHIQELIYRPTLH